MAASQLLTREPGPRTEAHATAPTSSGTSPRQLALLAASVAALSLPALLGRAVVPDAVALRLAATPGDPWLVPGHALLLYVGVPAVAVSTCVLVLAPGLFLALALRRGRSAGEWLLSGLALSLVVVSLAAALGQGLVGEGMRGGTFALLVAASAAVCLGVAALRLRRTRQVGAEMPWPLGDGASRAFAAATLIAPALIVALLAPKFLWENFNGDGVHGFESARRLLVQAVPFWPADSGAVSAFPGLTSMLFAYPASWFIRLFGPLEAAARLPWLLYLQGLVAAVQALAHAGRGRPGSAREPWLLWLGMGAYVLTMAFSTTYNPYMADIALPATQDTLLLVCFFGFVLAFAQGEAAWAGLFGALTYLSLPSGLQLIVFFLAAAYLAWRPRPARMLRVGLAVLVGCMVGGALLTRLLPLLGQPAPGREYALLGMARYFAWLQFTDGSRLLYVLLPAGILPALALLAWRRQDGLARSLTLVTAAYFLFFFVQAHIALHHFVPAMLLPLVVFWRTIPQGGPARGRLELAAAVCAVLAIVLARPAQWSIDVSGRSAGEALVARTGDYERSDPAVFRASDLLSSLFPLDWSPEVPARYGGSPLVWNYYAHHAQRPAAEANYYLLPRSQTAPAGTHRVAANESVALYVRDDSVWRAQMAVRPASRPGAALLRVPRGILFRSVPLENGPFILDLPALLQRMGFDLAPLKARAAQ